jgi:hypothetical protein
VAIAFLAEEKAAFIIGQTLFVATATSIPALMHELVNLRLPLEILDSCAARCARRKK